MELDDNEFVRVDGPKSVVDNVKSWADEEEGSENHTKHLFINSVVERKLSESDEVDGERINIDIEHGIKTVEKDNVADVVVDGEIAIEAKGKNGNVRTAVGQAMMYKLGGYKSYICIPSDHSMDMHDVNLLCKYAGVGFIRVYDNSIFIITPDPHDDTWFGGDENGLLHTDDYEPDIQGRLELGMNISIRDQIF